MIEEVIELFVLGLLGTGCLAFVVLLICMILMFPHYLLYASGGFLFVISVGWCVKHYDDFKALFIKPIQPDLFKIPKTNYGNKTLDGLSYFEKKYGMTTVQFMGFVYKDLMPHGMNNLDYIEWLAMAVALGTFQDPSEEGE
jgi:hypothetical protein